MTAVTVCSSFESQENKVCHCFHFLPICLPWSDGTNAMNLVFWMLSLRPAISLSSFPLITKLFISSLLSAFILFFSHSIVSYYLQTAAHQTLLSFTITWSLLKLISIELVMPSNISSSVIPFSSCLQSFPVGLFQWVSSSHQVDKVSELQLQHKSFQWVFRVDFL